MFYDGAEQQIFIVDNRSNVLRFDHFLKLEGNYPNIPYPLLSMISLPDIPTYHINFYTHDSNQNMLRYSTLLYPTLPYTTGIIPYETFEIAQLCQLQKIFSNRLSYALVIARSRLRDHQNKFDDDTLRGNLSTTPTLPYPAFPAPTLLNY